MTEMECNADLVTDLYTGLTEQEITAIRSAMQIPGQLSEIELVEICRIARAVPEGGIIVEVGSLFGRSSYVWANCSKPDVMVYCVDPWERVPWIIEWVEKPLAVTRPFSLDAFLHFTGNSKKIVPIQGYSPDCAGDWSTPIDVYFDDAVHEDPGFSRNVEYWLQHLKPGGVFAGDDFRPDWYDITRRVVTTAQEWRTRLQVTGNLFWMRKPNRD